MKRSIVLCAVLAVTTSMHLTAGSAAAAPQPPGLDHLQCYPGTTVKDAFPDRAAAVLLHDQLVPTGMLASVEGFTMHCTPVQKTTPDGAVTPVAHPDDQLTCFAITPNRVPPAAVQSFTVSVGNQFGEGKVTTGRATSLCLPARSSTTNPPSFPAGSPKLDHLTCYDVKPAAGQPRFPAPPSVQLKDQYGTSTARLGAATALCVPTLETTDPDVPGDVLLDADDHLLCFKSTQTKVVFPAQVVDSNQFGSGQVRLRHSNGTLLCLPSFAEVVAP